MKSMNETQEQEDECSHGICDGSGMEEVSDAPDSFYTKKCICLLETEAEADGDEARLNNEEYA